MTFTVPMVRADWLTVETVVILCTSTATGQYHHANVSPKHHRTDTQFTHTHTHTHTERERKTERMCAPVCVGVC